MSLLWQCEGASLDVTGAQVVQVSGDAEVRNFGVAARLVEQDVRALDVTVHHPIVVEVTQSARDLGGQAQHEDDVSTRCASLRHPLRQIQSASQEGS